MGRRRRKAFVHCRPPPKLGGAVAVPEAASVHANYVRKVWQQVVRDDNASYRQRMHAELAQREDQHRACSCVHRAARSVTLV